MFLTKKKTNESISDGAKDVRYFVSMLHQLPIIIQTYHHNTKNTPKHLALGQTYDELEKIKDEIIEQIIGYTGERYEKTGLANVDINDKDMMDLPEFVINFAKELKEWASENGYDNIENMAQEYSGFGAKLKYLLSLNESARVYPPHKKFSTNILQDIMSRYRCTSAQWEELKLRLWDRTGLKTELYELEQKLDAIVSKTIKEKILKDLETELLARNSKEKENTSESDENKYISQYKNRTIDQLNKEQEKLEKDIETFDKKSNPSEQESQKNLDDVERLAAIKELKGQSTEMVDEGSDKEWYRLKLAISKATKDQNSGVCRLFGTPSKWAPFEIGESPWSALWKGSGNPSDQINRANTFLNTLGYEMKDNGNRNMSISKIENNVEESQENDLELYYQLAKKAFEENKIKDLSPSYHKTKGFAFYQIDDKCDVNISFENSSKCVVIEQDYKDGNVPETDDISLEGFAKYLGVDMISEEKNLKFGDIVKFRSRIDGKEYTGKYIEDYKNGWIVIDCGVDGKKTTVPNDCQKTENMAENNELKIGDTVTFTLQPSGETLTGKYIKDYDDGSIIVDCGKGKKVAIFPKQCTKVNESGEEPMSLRELETYVIKNEDLIKSNAKIYGFDDIASIDNYMDLANLLGVDSRRLKTVELSVYSKLVDELLTNDEMDESSDFYRNNRNNSKTYKIIDQVGVFWVVTKPTKDSTLGDILFESDIIYLANQIRGGLTEREIFGFYIDGGEAEKVAKDLLKKPLIESIVSWNSLSSESKSYLNNNVEKVGDSFVVDDVDGNSVKATAISKKDKIYAASEQKFNYRLETIKN